MSSCAGKMLKRSRAPRALDGSHLRSFIAKLRPGTPRTLSVIGVAHHIIQGKLEGQVYTNGWPEFSAVICQASTSPGLPSVVEVTCYATTHSTFQDVLRMLVETELLLSSDWKVTRLKCDTDLSIYLQRELTTVYPSLQVETVFNGFNYYMPVQSQTIPECPKGYILKSLGEHHADFISRYWDWLFDHTQKVSFFKGLINNFHSIGIFTNDGSDQPIGWCVQYSNARLAHLFVLKDYRQRGFASLLYQHICKAIMADGLLPEVVVYEHNDIGISLLEKLGFIRSANHTGLLVKQKN